MSGNRDAHNIVTQLTVNDLMHVSKNLQYILWTKIVIYLKCYMHHMNGTMLNTKMKWSAIWEN